MTVQWVGLLKRTTYRALSRPWYRRYWLYVKGGQQAPGGVWHTLYLGPIALHWK